jgi:hypothetical protein
MRYVRNQIRELIELLGNEDLLMVYKGLIGLCSFGDGLINRANEDELLGMGLVPKLVQLVGWQDHPFIQFHSLDILKSIGKNSGS